MFKTIVSAAIAATAFATPALAQGWTPPAPEMNVTRPDAPTAVSFFKPGTGVFIVSAKQRAAADAWWARRAERRSERRMAACAAMPECSDARKGSSNNS